MTDMRYSKADDAAVQDYPMSSIERQFRALYLDGGERYLKKPMLLSEYKALPRERRIMDDVIARYQEENPSGNFYTIRDTHKPGSEDLVEIAMHGRYSYPLLHNHGYIELVYVYHGSCTHFVADNTLAMKTGDFCILSPDTVHAISAVHDDDILFNIIVSQPFFGNSFLNMLRKEPAIVEFFENILYSRQVSPYILYPTGEDPFMHGLLASMYAERKGTDYLYGESMALFVRQIFVYLLRHYEMNAVVADPVSHSMETNIVALISYISANYDHITLASTAQFFGYNMNYLSQLLKRCTGKNFTEMITDAQVNNACRLLKETSLSVTDIAGSVGCYDASHFTRKFKSAMKMTPLEYRKRSRTEAAQDPDAR